MRSKVIFTAIILLMFIAGVLQGCGARKVETTISKQSETAKEEVKSEGSVKKENTTTDNSNSSVKNDKVDEKQEQRITELYNENGTLKSRITELLNSKSKDKSTKDESRLQELKTNTDSIFNNTVYRTKTITIKEKAKQTETNNNALYWMIGGVLGLIVVGFFVYKYFTR